MKGLDVEDAECIVVFAKAAVAGRAKTRLAASIGSERAVALYAAFLEDVASMVAGQRGDSSDPVAPILAHAGHPEHPSFEPFRHLDFTFVSQGGGDLGDRLARVTRRCFDSGARRVLTIGSDTPTLQPGHFSSARSELASHDVVVGPSFDGGYWLIGSQQPVDELFRGIDWSTPRVLRQTLRRAEESGLLCGLLEFWYDIDTFADLRRLRTHLLDYLVDQEDATPGRTTRVLDELEDAGLFDGSCDEDRAG